MSDHRDHIAGLIDDLLDTQDKRTLTGTALVAIGAVSDETYIQVRAHREELAYAQMDQEQALLDAVTTDAEHAAKWRELVEQLDLDLDDTEVPAIFDTFEQRDKTDTSWVRTEGVPRVIRFEDVEPGQRIAAIQEEIIVRGVVKSKLNHSVNLQPDESSNTQHWMDHINAMYVLYGEYAEGDQAATEPERSSNIRTDRPESDEHPESPPDPQEHPLIRVHAFRGEELDEPIDAAWFGSLFHSIHKKVFPDGSEYLYPHEATRWTPLEVRVVSGDE